MYNPNVANAVADAQSAVNAIGRNEATAGQVEVKPVVLQGIITYTVELAMPEKTFFEAGVTLPKSFTGTKTYPNGFTNETVRLDRVEILPRISFAVLEASGTDEDAYHLFLTGTQVRFKVDNTEVFEAPLFFFTGQRPVGNGQGTDVLLTKTGDFSVRLPAPIVIPAGSQLTVTVTPPVGGGLTTLAAAATNPHYPNVNVAGSSGTTARACALHFYGHGVKWAVAK